MRKSMSQTSPRSGTGILFVEGIKQGGRARTDLFVFQRTGIERQRAAQRFFGESSLLFCKANARRRRAGPWFRGLFVQVSKDCDGICSPVRQVR
jgi:hypothetical protein